MEFGTYLLQVIYCNLYSESNNKKGTNYNFEEDKIAVKNSVFEFKYFCNILKFKFKRMLKTNQSTCIFI